MPEIYTHEFRNSISAKEKNEVLLSYKGLADYILFKNTELEVLNPNATNIYIEKMEKYDLCCIFYGFTNPSNSVLGKINYAMEVTVDDATVERFVRFSAFDYVIIDNRKEIPLFDDRFKALDFNLWLQECAEKKLIPFNGIYFDIENSFEMFGKMSSLNKESVINRNNDIKTMGNLKLVLKYDNSADEVFKLLKSKKEIK